MLRDKELYHQLHNLEDHPGTLAPPECPPCDQADCAAALETARTRLEVMLDESMAEAEQSATSILSLGSTFSPDALKRFLQRQSCFRQRPVRGLPGEAQDWRSAGALAHARARARVDSPGQSGQVC